ncbi:hypothetical protein SYNPS1DRAFT_27213 [Syncephalis pseudoplumigaleata]|uniref:SUI1 domain-containing protein n=1 Tax=Syncephalis pseudoplumigaleata TaxID=1712513 RepID=A0A4P9Z3Y9_9FUNG|nr:hypothetical protein SYNPS1DRAFT_27213 [Syncephalis pseudoplumigaleata]|eukprot:RKP27118.1 hypothetical protein SYNPS1DRAFT_27213 [Syncephalis pseudoplumigaleata]
MDPTLALVLLTKNERDSINQLERASLVERLCQSMTPHHIINLPGKDPVAVKGVFSPVQVIVEERASKKTVTRILKLEMFMLNLEEIANKLKIECASSISIAGKKDANELMVQGNHVAKVKKILASYHVPERYIEVDMNLKKKKKK